MENKRNSTPERPETPPSGDLVDDLENISSQVESALIGARLSIEIIDLILNTYLTPDIPRNMEPREPGDPSVEVHPDGIRIRYNSHARTAEEELSDGAAEANDAEGTDVAGAAAIDEEPPIPGYAAAAMDIPSSLPDFDNYMNWRCNDCEKYVVGFGVGAFILTMIVFFRFLQTMSDRE